MDKLAISADEAHYDDRTHDQADPVDPSRSIYSDRRMGARCALADDAERLGHESSVGQRKMARRLQEILKERLSASVSVSRAQAAATRQPQRD